MLELESKKTKVCAKLSKHLKANFFHQNRPPSTGSSAHRRSLRHPHECHLHRRICRFCIRPYISPPRRSLSPSLSLHRGTGVQRDTRQKHSCIFNQYPLNIKQRQHTHTRRDTQSLTRRVIQVDGQTCVCMSVRACASVRWL